MKTDISGENLNLTESNEESQDEEIKCQDYFNGEDAMILKITDESDGAFIVMQYLNERIKINDLDITEVIFKIIVHFLLTVEILKFYMMETESTPVLNRLTIQNNPVSQKSDLYINDVLFPLDLPIQVRFLKVNKLAYESCQYFTGSDRKCC